jgi:hypothetical protein
MDPQVPQPNYAYQHVPTSGTGFAIASLICGLAGLLLFSIILGPLAIIFGAVGIAKANANPIGAGKGMAVAGLVFGVIDLVLFFVIVSAYL